MRAEGRILLIRLGGLGDLIFTLPAVQAVQAAFPQSRITFLVDKELAPVLEGFGAVHATLCLDRAGYRRLNPMVLLGGTWWLLSRLKWPGFSLAVDFHGFGETAWLTWWSGAPQRWGNVYQPARSWAYTRPVRHNSAMHPIDFNLDLLRQAGGLQPAAPSNLFRVPEKVMAEAGLCFQERNLNPGRPTLLLQPFTSSPWKDWPLEHYLRIAQRGRASGLQILFGGGPANRPALEAVRQAGFAVAAGTPLLVSAGLAQLSTVVLGGDTGLLHLAVAMGKRVIMLMTSLHAGACYPFGHPEWAIAPPGGAPITSIPIDSVWNACSTALEELGAGAYLAERGH
jgi:ADP-heptose:LPS heptosyltransferase